MTSFIVLDVSECHAVGTPTRADQRGSRAGRSNDHVAPDGTSNPLVQPFQSSFPPRSAT